MKKKSSVLILAAVMSPMLMSCSSELQPCGVAEQVTTEPGKIAGSNQDFYNVQINLKYGVIMPTVIDVNGRRNLGWPLGSGPDITMAFSVGEYVVAGYGENGSGCQTRFFVKKA